MGDFRTGIIYGLAIALVLIAVLIAGPLWYCLGVPGRSHQGPLPPASAEEADLAVRLRRHVAAIASVPHNMRYYAQLQAVAAYIEETLTATGFDVVSQTYEVNGRAARNLEVTIEPAAAGPDTKSIVVGAHYDSAGDAPGANDNGTGTAAVIELARLLKGAALNARIRLVLFVNEEPPYFQTSDMGSFRYAQLLAGRKEPVAAMMSLETLGYFSGAPGSQTYPAPLGAFFSDKANFIAFVGTLGSRGLVRQAIGSFRKHTAFPSIGGVAPGFIPGIDWSDHWSFTQHGFPSIMITDTAVFRYPHYHLPSDTPDKVDYESLARITKGLEHIIRDLAG
jgi:hypothetical protein